MLIDKPDANVAANAVATFAEATFGDIKPYMDRSDAWLIAQKAAAFEGVVPNALETVSLTFAISGVSRTTTHQLVRTRVGAGFGQQSLRANNVKGFNMRVPATTAAFTPTVLKEYYEDILPQLRKLYDRLLVQGIPYQDARYFLPMGMETSIVATYNLLSLIGTLQRRLCNRMQWEINYVARLMADLTVEAFPWVGLALRTRCEKTGVCQTVDPMFPPSCFHKGLHCSDAEALEKQSHGMYNWPISQNDAFMKFAWEDRDRTLVESEGKEVLSMVDPEDILARKIDGVWKGEV